MSFFSGRSFSRGRSLMARAGTRAAQQTPLGSFGGVGGATFAPYSSSSSASSSYPNGAGGGGGSGLVSSSPPFDYEINKTAIATAAAIAASDSSSSQLLGERGGAAAEDDAVLCSLDLYMPALASKMVSAPINIPQSSHNKNNTGGSSSSASNNHVLDVSWNPTDMMMTMVPTACSTSSSLPTYFTNPAAATEYGAATMSSSVSADYNGWTANGEFCCSSGSNNNNNGGGTSSAPLCLPRPASPPLAPTSAFRKLASQSSGGMITGIGLEEMDAELGMLQVLESEAAFRLCRGSERLSVGRMSCNNTNTATNTNTNLHVASSSRPSHSGNHPCEAIIGLAELCGVDGGAGIWREDNNHEHLHPHPQALSVSSTPSRKVKRFSSNNSSRCGGSVRSARSTTSDHADGIAGARRVKKHHSTTATTTAVAATNSSPTRLSSACLSAAAAFAAQNRAGDASPARQQRQQQQHPSSPFVAEQVTSENIDDVSSTVEYLQPDEVIGLTTTVTPESTPAAISRSDSATLFPHHLAQGGGMVMSSSMCDALILREMEEMRAQVDHYDTANAALKKRITSMTSRLNKAEKEKDKLVQQAKEWVLQEREGVERVHELLERL